MFNLTGTFCVFRRCPATHIESQDMVVHFNIQPWWMEDGLEGPQEVLLMLFPEIRCFCETRRQGTQIYHPENLVKYLSCEGSRFSYSLGQGFSIYFLKLNLGRFPSYSYILSLLSYQPKDDDLRPFSYSNKLKEEEHPHKFCPVDHAENQSLTSHWGAEHSNRAS